MQSLDEKDLLNGAKKLELEAIIRLLEIGIHRDILKETILHHAARAGRVDIINVLINADVEVNFVSADGQTALIQATRNGHLEVVNSLINAGADVNYVSADGTTALMVAINEKHLNVFFALRRAGAQGNGILFKLFTYLIAHDHFRNHATSALKAQYLILLSKLPIELVDHVVDFISIKDSYRMTLKDYFSNPERKRIANYMSLLHSLQETIKKNPNFIHTLDPGIFMPLERIPSEEDIKTIKHLIELVKVPSHLASLAQKNGLILKILSSKVKNDPAFFGAILRGPVCDRNNELKQEYTRSYLSKNAPHFEEHIILTVIAGFILSEKMGLSRELSTFISLALGATLAIVTALKIRAYQKPSEPAPQTKSSLFRPSLEHIEESKEAKTAPAKK
jgi:hypothetical protein